MLGLGLIALFIFICFVLSPTKKETLLTYVFFEDENEVSMKVLTSSLRETKPATSLYIGMFTGTNEDASSIRELLDRQRNYHRKRTEEQQVRV